MWLLWGSEDWLSHTNNSWFIWADYLTLKLPISCPLKSAESLRLLCDESEWCLAISQEIWTREEFFPHLKMLFYFQHGTGWKSIGASLSFSLLFLPKKTVNSLNSVQKICLCSIVGELFVKLKEENTTSWCFPESGPCMCVLLLACFWSSYWVPSPKLVSI